MNTLNENIAIFRADQFKKEYQVGNTILNINNMEHMVYAIRKAYVDLTPRTLKKLHPDARIQTKKRDEVLKWLAEELQKYLQADAKEEFAIWHSSVCNAFLNKFNTDVLTDCYHPAYFGKAQKIVNMALKYIRCFDDAPSYQEIYQECHMAIDSYILDWYNKELSLAMSVPKITTAWSNLSEQKYIEIQENIASYLNSPRNTRFSVIPFEAEFNIWWEEKQRRVNKK